MPAKGLIHAIVEITGGLSQGYGSITKLSALDISVMMTIVVNHTDICWTKRVKGVGHWSL